jgi:hypothetical protein
MLCCVLHAALQASADSGSNSLKSSLVVHGLGLLHLQGAGIVCALKVYAHACCGSQPVVMPAFMFGRLRAACAVTAQQLCGAATSPGACCTDRGWIIEPQQVVAGINRVIDSCRRVVEAAGVCAIGADAAVVARALGCFPVPS